VFDVLVERVQNASGIELYDAVEAGVPAWTVDVIAESTGKPSTSVMEMLGLSATTFRRKDEAKEPLPDVVGHRVMGWLRIAATLRRLLEESGDPDALASFDLATWLAEWMRQSLPALGGKSPAEMLRNPEGLRAVEQLIERMRGGLPA
jgi:putative toxin-antitoxin system antitoxin component (TIGR02293 family)